MKFGRYGAIVAALAVAAVVAAQAGTFASSGSKLTRLERVRKGTGVFHSEPLAVAAGFEADPVCVESPAGGMGIHYVNEERIRDGVINRDKPEVLLYAPAASGEPKLVAVEYMKPDADQNLETDGDRPRLFGKAFDGPMEGHGPGMPIHYDLHVWVWKKNPAGMFAQFNPKVGCPSE